MPIPLFFIGAGLATSLFGAGKTIKAGMDNRKAKDITDSANRIIATAKAELDDKRKAAGTSLEKYGELKLFVLNHTVKEFLNSFEKIKHVEFTGTEGLNELSRLRIDKASFEELRKMENFASSLVSGTATGALGGALTAFGAYSAAGMFASASTGTAIATLHGVAATNATLAFFGGGAVYAGGLGVLGGTYVLGGLVAGPALAVLGLISGAKASKNLDNAYANKAKAQEICEELKTLSFQSSAVRKRTYMFYYLLTKLDAYFLPMIFRMEEIIDNEGTDYKTYTAESKAVIAAVASTAASVKVILDTPILKEDGDLTERSETVSHSINVFLDEKKTI